MDRPAIRNHSSSGSSDGLEPSSGKAVHNNSSSLHPPGTLKRGDACLFCRKRKLKCDAVKPHCAQCVRLKKSPCVYGGTRDGESSNNSHQTRPSAPPLPPPPVPTAQVPVTQVHQTTIDESRRTVETLKDQIEIGSSKTNAKEQTQMGERSTFQAQTHAGYSSLPTPRDEMPFTPGTMEVVNALLEGDLETVMSLQARETNSIPMDVNGFSGSTDFRMDRDSLQDTMLLNNSNGVKEMMAFMDLEMGTMGSPIETGTQTGSSGRIDNNVASGSNSSDNSPPIETPDDGQASMDWLQNVLFNPDQASNDIIQELRGASEKGMSPSGFSLMLEKFQLPTNVGFSDMRRTLSSRLIGNEPSIAHHRDSLSSGSSPQALSRHWTTAPSEIPPFLREKLIGSFAKESRRFGLDYHWPRFWERMRGEEANRPHSAWVYSIYLMGARSSGDPSLKQMESEFLRTAEAKLQSGIEEYSRPVDLIRAAIVLGLYFYWIGSYQKAWIMAGMAMKLVISSGLHQMATGSHTRLMENGWRTKYDEDPCIRRKIVYTLPPPIDGIDLGERIACFWEAHTLDRAGAIAVNWDPVLDYRRITTPWRLPYATYEKDFEVPIRDETYRDLMAGRLTCSNDPDLYGPLMSQSLELIFRASRLIQLPSENDNLFNPMGIAEQDQYLSEISTAVRCPQAHYELENAFYALSARVPEELKEPISIITLNSSQMEESTIEVMNIENYNLQIRLLSIQLWLYDVDDWQYDNSRALQIARKMLSLSTHIPDHEFKNLEGFVCVLWIQCARIIMKELKRMTAMGNNTGISRANGELDTIAKHLTKASAGSTLAPATTFPPTLVLILVPIASINQNFSIAIFHLGYLLRLSSSMSTNIDQEKPFSESYTSVSINMTKDEIVRPSTPVTPPGDLNYLGSSPSTIAAPLTPRDRELYIRPSLVTFDPPSPSGVFYDGTKTANSSATAFETNILNSSQSYLVVDPKNKQHFDAGAPKKKKVDFNKPLKFWLIFLSLCFSCLLSALDLTAISTALPDIINDLQGQDYIWVGSAYALTSTAFLPFCGSMANILGRRSTMIFSLVIFMFGSGLCGGSKYVNSMNMLIAARSIQGVGGGGILAMTEIIVADMLPLSERGVFSGIIGCVWAFASAIGPLIGGALAKQWQWLFFVNLPLGVVALALVWMFLDIKAPKEDLKTRLKQMDIVGNLLIIGGTTSVIIGIVWGGSKESWDSYTVIVPLAVGAGATLGAFVYDFRWAVDPTIPFTIINNRTSISGYVQTFFHGIVTIIVIYYLPVYFQAIQGSSPVRSSIQTFPLSLTIAPLAIMTGAAVAIIGKYNWSNWSGWVLLTTGVGLLALLKEGSSVYMWAGFQAVAGIGAGLLYSGLNFPILAPTPPELNAPALAFLTFARSYGQVFGVTIGGSVMNNQLKKDLPSAFAAKFGAAPDLAYAAIPVLHDLEEPLKAQVIHAFMTSLRLVWFVCIPLSVVGLFANIFCKEIPMHRRLDENWGLTEQAKKQHDQEMGSMPDSAITPPAVGTAI